MKLFKYVLASLPRLYLYKMLTNIYQSEQGWIVTQKILPEKTYLTISTSASEEHGSVKGQGEPSSSAQISYNALYTTVMEA